MPAIARVAHRFIAPAGEVQREAAGRQDAPTSWRARGASLAVIGAAGALGCAAGLYVIEDRNVPADSINIGIASAGTVLATIAAYLFLLRMRRTGALVDVLLTATITFIAMSSVALALVVVSDAPGGAVSVRALISTGAGIVVSLGLAAAAFAASDPLTDPERSAERLLGWGVVLSLATTGIIAATLVVAGSAGRETATIMGDLFAATLAAVAAFGFVRRSQRSDERVFIWLGVALAVTATAHVTDATLPWSRAEDLSSGDVVQLAGWFALLIAGLRDMESASQDRTRAAVSDERRRLARELHDGLAQELAYISLESRRHDSTQHLAEVAERALEESRAAIAALTRPVDEPLERSIADAAQSVGARSGVDVSVAVRPGIDVTGEVRMTLLRVLREAMANAVRHGKARTIRVSVDGPAPLVMAVADDGSGFDLDAPRRPDAFGLLSMHERVENLGGRMTVESVPGRGTTIAVVLP